MSGGWIHSFTVTDTQTHKNGYTIYKITAIVFPRTIPEALTCTAVWRRFHEIKRLHRELSKRQKSLKIPGTMPEPTDSTYFKRFDPGVIERRKEFIIRFLDFVAQHSALYKCHVFYQFFNDPLQTESPTLNELQIEKNSNALTSFEEKEKKKISKSLVDISGNDLKENNEVQQTNVASKEIENTVDEEENLHKTSQENDKTPKDYTRFLTPMASIESEDSDYIYEAALEFSRAVQAEADLEYSEAHMRYKRGVELLLNGSKDDRNEERKMIAKTKIAKYLARADDIFAQLLSADNGEYTNSAIRKNKLNVQLSNDDMGEDIHSSYYIERPLNQLAKYKVLKILGKKVMQVYCVTDRQRSSYVIKGIEKPSSNSPTQTIFLPQHVPYMVDLLYFFQSDQKIYLLLRFAEGGCLLDYMRNYELKAQKHANLECIFAEVDKTDCKNETRNAIEIPTEATEHSELLRSSQLILQTVTSSLSEAKQQHEVSIKPTVPDDSLPNSANLYNLPEASIKKWAQELFVAIESLHEKGVILVDLHIHNLLLGDKGQLLLSYFYQNQTLNEEPYSLYAHSQHCIAPERPFTFKSDWWSYGIILYQLLLGVSFKSMHPGIIDIYGFVQYPDVEISDAGRDLLNNLLTQSPEERYDAEEIRAHAFFKGTNWDDLIREGTNTNASTMH